ncbi:MAG: alpha/beta fold hydrolase, partial [Hyphomicrobiaceae bacterium]
ANGQSFETFAAGDPQAPLLLFLHGFPEHARAWEKILPAFADKYYAVAPNQRGYGQSSKPTGIENYRVQHLAKDMLDLAGTLAPGKKIHLVAHDWGASVAYMMAFMAHARIATLTVLNGVHPIPFQRAILSDREQRQASQYMRFLRRDDAAPLLAESNYARLMAFMTGGFGGGRWMTDAERDQYLVNWSESGALEAMVSWYKATQLTVPKVDEIVTDDPLARINPTMVRVRVPHLVLWGEEDKALRPSCIDGLETFCDDLRIKKVAGADHWIVHQRPDIVIPEIHSFLKSHEGTL